MYGNNDGGLRIFNIVTVYVIDDNSIIVLSPVYVNWIIVKLIILQSILYPNTLLGDTSTKHLLYYVILCLLLNFILNPLLNTFLSILNFIT